jgi:hypothetical protein
VAWSRRTRSSGRRRRGRISRRSSTAREVKEFPSPAPPLFLAVAADDAGSVGRTVDLFTAYRKAKGPAELHVFQMGAHGFVNKGGGADHFMDRLEEWLGANQFLSKPPDRGASPQR